MSISENRKILNSKLKKYVDLPDYEYDFIMGVNAHLKTEESVSRMISWLEKHYDEQIASDEILLKALEIRHGRKLEVNGLTTRD